MERRKMWEVTIWDKRFNGVDKNMQPKVIKYHYYLANELSNLEQPNGDIRILYTTDKKAFVNSKDVEGNISEGEVVTIPWGGNLSIKYYKGKFVTADNRITTSKDVNILSNKFLYYWMLSQSAIIEGFYRGAGIKHPSMKSVLNLEIPIPSISEQNRIVDILDTFTATIDNLKEQIVQRRKQFEYYRNKLLSFEEGEEGVEWKLLDSICEIRGRIGFRGYTREDQVSKGEGVISLSPGNIVEGKIDYESCTYITWAKYEESPEIKIYNGDIIFCKTASVGKVAMIEDLPCEATINPQLVVLKNIQINSIYLKQYLASDKLQTKVKTLAGVGSVPNISQAKLGNLRIPVPPFAEQQDIANHLDTFESSIQNQEAQLELRQKQYEYYRNKLLSF